MTPAISRSPRTGTGAKAPGDPRHDTTPGARPKARTRAPANGLSKDDVLDAALRVIETGGVAALSMRRLADELGAAVTAIYWHVGNRDALLEILIDRLLAEMGDVHARGSDPRARIAGLAHELRARLLARPHLIALVDQRAMTASMFQPLQAAL